MIRSLVERKADIEMLCSKFCVSRLEILGSAATASFREEDGDLDFLVAFETAALGPGYADKFFDLKESLEVLLGRSVDLVVDSSIQNPYLRQSINRTRTLIYEA